MSGIAQDLKTGLKGIRGAGDALRGGLMEATDEAFDSNQKHPTTQYTEHKNDNILEKGKADMRGADNMISRHERHHEEAKEQAAIDRNGGAVTGQTGVGTGSGADVGARQV